jgi:hypothetical protein
MGFIDSISRYITSIKTTTTTKQKQTAKKKKKKENQQQNPPQKTPLKPFNITLKSISNIVMHKSIEDNLKVKEMYYTIIMALMWN